MMTYFNNAKENFNVDAEVGDALFGADDPDAFLGIIGGLDNDEEIALVNELYATGLLAEDDDN